MGELDETLLFYLKSRGIPKAQAQAMLIKAFLGDALEQIDDDAIASFMNQIIDDWAEQNNDALPWEIARNEPRKDCNAR